MKMTIRYGFVCLLPLFLAVVPTQGAPRSRKHESPHTVYDQKQTGDYNIQLHLKDFQIIALLAEDSGGFGDYDYNYDYSDFTVKPPSPATQKPPEVPPSSTPSSSTTPKASEQPSSSTPSNHPHITTEKPQPPKEEPPKGEETSTLANDTITGTPPKGDGVNSPGKIKVQIVGVPASVGVVPGEDSIDDGGASPSRRCSSGFSRDKRGRCRRVRRPGSGSSQLPYGFSRLASSLASRFRQASSETSSESVEN